MSLLETLNQDLKAAMLARDSLTADTIKSVKNVLLYKSVAVDNSRGEEVSDDLVLEAVKAELKKRNESAEMYDKVGGTEQAAKERHEAEILEKYLPKQLSVEELTEVVKTAAARMGVSDIKEMGKLIAEVKNEVGFSADGAKVAEAVRNFLQ